MIALRDQDREALYRLRRAGAVDGLPLGEVAVSTAILLQLAGLAEVKADADGWQFVRITRAGAAAAANGRFAA